MPDIFDDIFDALSDTDIPFAKQSWVNAPDEDYGVMTLSGSKQSVYADDKVVYQTQDAQIDVYTYGEGYDTIGDVEDALDAIDDVSWHMTKREYMQEFNMMHYTIILTAVVVG